jgi:hypothetical protein
MMVGADVRGDVGRLVGLEVGADVGLEMGEAEGEAVGAAMGGGGPHTASLAPMRDCTEHSSITTWLSGQPQSTRTKSNLPPSQLLNLDSKLH